MGAYVTGMIVAITMFFGVHSTAESIACSPTIVQDKLNSRTPNELRILAADFKSEDQIEAVIQLGDRPGELSETVLLLAKLSVTRKELVRHAAEASLKTIGAPAAKHLKPILEEESLRSYVVACTAMKAIGPGSKIYLPEIKKLLVDDDAAKRRCGLFALQGMGFEGVVLMKEVIGCVLDKDFNNQCSACRVLEKFGTEAYEAEDALLQLLDEGVSAAQGWDAVYLDEIGPTTSEIDIAELLGSKLNAERVLSPIVQERILLGLAYLGPDAAKVVETVRAKLNGRNKYVRCHAAFALWKITGNADESLKALDELIGNPHFADDALDVVGRMGTAAIPILDVVTGCLRASEPGTRELALVAIGNMGPAASAAESDVMELLNDDDALVRMAAKQTLLELEETEQGSESEPEEKE